MSEYQMAHVHNLLTADEDLTNRVKQVFYSKQSRPAASAKICKSAACHLSQ